MRSKLVGILLASLGAFCFARASTSSIGSATTAEIFQAPLAGLDGLAVLVTTDAYVGERRELAQAAIKERAEAALRRSKIPMRPMTPGEFSDASAILGIMILPIPGDPRSVRVEVRVVGTMVNPRNGAKCTMALWENFASCRDDRVPLAEVENLVNKLAIDLLNANRAFAK